MPNDDSRAPRARSAPKVVAPTNRINVALPFSHIRVEESSRELVELADVVGRLVDAVGTVAPGPEVQRLKEQMAALTSRLR